MEYVVFSCFQVDPQSSPKWDICYRHKKYNKCKVFCNEKKENGSLAEYYICENGEYPVGYLISHGMLPKTGYSYHC